MSGSDFPEDSFPVEARKLPTLNIDHDLDRTDLYKRIEDPCRRCNGEKTDPNGDYPCLLCKGKGSEDLLSSAQLVCAKHPEHVLVNIGKRRYEWEDAMGFDHQGYLAVRGCPVCMIPALSRR